MESKLMNLAVVSVIVWVVLFVYLMMIDRKLSRFEAKRPEDDL